MINIVNKKTHNSICSTGIKMRPSLRGWHDQTQEVVKWCVDGSRFDSHQAHGAAVGGY